MCSTHQPPTPHYSNMYYKTPLYWLMLFEGQFMNWSVARVCAGSDRWHLWHSRKKQTNEGKTTRLAEKRSDWNDSKHFEDEQKVFAFWHSSHVEIRTEQTLKWGKCRLHKHKRWWLLITIHRGRDGLNHLLSQDTWADLHLRDALKTHPPTHPTEKLDDSSTLLMSPCRKCDVSLNKKSVILSRNPLPLMMCLVFPSSEKHFLHDPLVTSQIDVQAQLPRWCRASFRR